MNRKNASLMNTKAAGFKSLPAVLALVAAVVLAPVSGTSAATATRYRLAAAKAASGQLTWGVDFADPTNLNPFLDSDEGAYVFYLVYQGLTQPGPGGTVAPLLATSWEQTSPTTWVFQLRHDVRFSNGSPMTASDVVTSFNEWEASKEYAFLFSPATKATAMGNYAVQFTLSTPDVGFPSELNYLLVLPGKELLNKTLNPATTTLGTGPYVLSGHVPNVSRTFTANPYYWRKGFPVVPTVVERYILNPVSLESALRDGTVDFEQATTADDMTALAGRNIKVQAVDTPDFYYIAINALKPTASAFKNVLVRRAVNLAINRQEIIQDVFGGYSQATGIPPSTFADGCKTANLAGTTQNLVAAKALMKRAGVSGITTTLYISPLTGAVDAPAIAPVVQSNLASIGINTSIETEDLAGWVNTIFTKSDFSLTINWWTGFGDPTTRLSSWEPKVAQYDAGYLADDPTLDGLITHADALPQSTARTGLFQQICGRVMSDANIVPLVIKKLFVAYRSDLVIPVFPSFEPDSNAFRYIEDYKLVG